MLRTRRGASRPAYGPVDETASAPVDPGARLTFRLPALDGRLLAVSHPDEPRSRGSPVSRHDHDRDPKKREICVVLCTCPPAEAERLAGLLVEKGLAACVNVVPGLTSVYRWEGKVCRDPESLLVIKCPRRGVEVLTEALVEAHPYDVPEVIALKVKDGNRAYLDWVVASCSGGGGG
ncbi:MAG: divalent-cation tolerance protein CutA [Planctomycetes bacterium]|nr:divalent-cation tolerance protein CutA [Planctomycetota bacterium]